MLGIPSGGGKDEKRPERQERKKDDRPRGGPMVVIKRASGVVETKAPEAEAGPVVEVKPGTPAAAAGDVKPQVTPAPAPNSPLYEEVAEAQSFAEMFEQSGKEGLSKKLPKVGEKIRAKIFQLGADTAFLSLGGKSEAMIDLSELKDEQGILRFGVGDEVEAHVVETGAKGVILSRKISKNAASLSLLAEAKHTGMPVEGLVIAVNKGGIEVAVGEVRAFCPSSQVDVRFVGKLESFVGEKLMFRVTEVKERNVVLSRRALLEEENKGKAEELKKELAPGKVLKGQVTGVRDFGAFVDLGGIEGMVPVSEMSHQRVQHPSDVVQVGDDVEVEVLRFEPAEPGAADKAKRKDRITLSLRARQEDPWKAALEELKEGSQVKGKVVRLQAFGAFVELKPGVDGLIHVSALSDRRIAHPRDAVKVGDEVEVLIEKVDPAEKRLGLRLVKDGAVVGQGVASSSPAPAEPREVRERPEGQQSAPKARRGQIVTAKVERIETFGVFVGWEGGKGLIPASETGTERGTDLRRVFPLGKEVKAEIIEMEGSKLKLSISAAVRSEERADLDAWKKTQKSEQKGAGGKGFGTLADKLKGLKL
ncbi:MAG: S1 RNA-binding domain-containing protein [Archangiaceae bacterium]|nr:S1 RNA-binding domain-containing protein [Archangiaceae bacterium]